MTQGASYGLDRREQQAYAASWAKVSLNQGTHPIEFICPITQGVMRDPVMAGDGHSHERAAITRWLRQHETSPITMLPLNPDLLVPNHALRGRIADYWPALEAASLDLGRPRQPYPAVAEGLSPPAGATPQTSPRRGSPQRPQTPPALASDVDALWRDYVFDLHDM